MRFRLSTKPPLKPLKVWYDVPDESLVFDIRALKTHILERLPQLSAEDGTRFKPESLQLYIDDFELLNDSNVSVIKENDLVCLSCAPNQASKKRKAAQTLEQPRKRRHLPSTSSSSSSKSSDPSSISSSESESDSDSSSSESTSSSDSDSDSESSNESSSSLTVSVRTPKLVPRSPVPNQNAKQIPPGQGKRTTQSRNARRRMKRAYERQASERARAATNALDEASVNAIPLGSRTSAQPLPETASTIKDHSPTDLLIHQQSVDLAENLSTTLRNKNKRKGFKQTMTEAVPKRIVFNDKGSTSAPRGTNNDSGSASTLSNPAPRLVTPSEKQAQGLLPSNVFVTSVEVEKPNWDRKKKKKKRNDYDEDLEGDFGNEVDEQLVLNYEEEVQKPGPDAVNFDAIEKEWENYEAISDMACLKQGSLVGWKELALNPMTMSPEILVEVAAVESIYCITGIVCFIRKKRPSREALMGDDEAEDEDLEHMSFAEALNAGWRLIQTSR